MVSVLENDKVPRCSNHSASPLELDSLKWHNYINCVNFRIRNSMVESSPLRSPEKGEGKKERKKSR